MICCLSFEQPLEPQPVQMAFDTVELLAGLVNESSRFADATDICNGLQMVNRLRNRTFELTAGKLYFDSQRTHNMNINIYGFNRTTMGLQVGEKSTQTTANLTFFSHFSQISPLKKYSTSISPTNGW